MAHTDRSLNDHIHIYSRDLKGPTYTLCIANSATGEMLGLVILDTVTPDLGEVILPPSWVKMQDPAFKAWMAEMESFAKERGFKELEGWTTQELGEKFLLLDSRIQKTKEFVQCGYNRKIRFVWKLNTNTPQE